MKKILNYLSVIFLTIIISCSGVNAAEVELDVESSEVVSLYNKVNVFTKGLSSDDLYGYLYMRDSYTVNDLSNDAKIMIGSYTLTNGGKDIGDVENPTTFTKDQMAQAIKSVLGNDISYNDGTLSIGSRHCAIAPNEYKNDTYYFMFGCGGLGPVFEKRILKAVKTDTTIEIYDNAIYVKPMIQINGVDHYEIYTPDKATLIATLSDNESNDTENYLNKGYVYKYTYTLDSDTNEYYFTSIKKVDYKFDEIKNQEQVVEESSVENPNTGLYIGIGGVLLILLSSIVMKKKNKFSRL